MGLSGVAAASPRSAAPPAVAMALGFVALLAGCHGRGATPAPDVVLVSLDTTRADRIGAYGDTAADTPTLDAIARRGVLFEHAQTVAPLTLPAHASLLTGASPPRHGLRENGRGRLPGGIGTLAEAFQRGGWTTIAVVGAFVLDRRFGLDRGFEVYDDSMPSGARRLAAERSAAAVTATALEHLDRAPAGRPVFVWVHYFDAHAPYEPPPNGGSADGADPYRGEIASVDRQLGRLLAHWDAGPRRTRPRLLSIVADHGEALGDHGESTHGMLLYQSTLRVPWLLEGRGVPRGGRLPFPVSLLDVPATLASLAGLQPMAAPDGRDLGPWLDGGAPAATLLYAETEYPRQHGWTPLRAARRGAHKAIFGEGLRAELFALDGDPGEHVDLGPREARSMATLVGEARRFERDATSEAPPPPSESAMNLEERRRLAALGYLGAANRRGPTRLADPRDRMDWLRRFEAALAAGPLAPPESLLELESLLRLDPENPLLESELAKAYRSAGRAADAVRLLDRAVGARPDDAALWYDLGGAAADAGDAKAALAAFRRSAALEPADAEAWNALGVQAVNTGAVTEAAAAFERAVEVDPRHAEAWTNLGHALRSLGQAGRAGDAYHQARTLDPDHAEAWNGIGVLAVERKDWQAAAAAFDRVLAIDPRHAEALLNRAVALDLAGDRVGADQAYRRFLARAAGEPRFRIQAAAVRQRLEAPAGARPVP